MSALFLSTDTLDKPLEGYAAHRKTPPSTDSLTQRSYLTHNKTTAIPNRTAAATVVNREARLSSLQPVIRRRPRTKGPDGFPSECIPQHEAPSKCAKRAIFSPASNPPKTGHRRARHQLTFRHTPQDARSPRRTKCAARASCMSEDVPKSKLMAGPDDYRAIDYPVFCNPAETPVTVERIRLMYSAFFSSAISSWFIRTSRRARTWAMDRAST